MNHLKIKLRKHISIYNSIERIKCLEINKKCARLVYQKLQNVAERNYRRFK